jgi:hypothetical protein
MKMLQSKKDLELAMLKYFSEAGKVTPRSEWRKLSEDDKPVTRKQFSRFFNGRTYHQVLKSLKRQYPVEWAAIGSVPVEAPKAEPVKAAPKVKPVLEPASGKDFSPLEKLKSKKGESVE